jgi:putative peptidoglycan lipid II flippase
MLVFAPAPQYHFVFDGNHVVTTIARADRGIMIAAIGWLFGSVAYVLIQLPGMRGAKLHVTINWKHPAIRRIGLLYIPVMLSLIMDTLIIRPFSYSLASRTGEGNISYMDWATTLIQFPQGLVATAISIAILPTLSRQAALILPLHLSQTTESNDNRTAFKDTLGLGLRLAITLILPAAVGLFVLATPIITLIFQHGAFHAADTAMTAKVLRLYLIGLPFAAIDLLLVYAFYARQDTLTPALVGVFSLAVYMVTALILFGRYGLFSLMIADSVKHIVHSVISGYLLRRRMGGFGDQRFLLTAGKTGLAVLGMGLASAGALPILRDVIGSAGLIHEAALVAACGALSVGVFTVMAVILKLDEWRWLAGVIRRKLSGG